jgi:hypothetical protein
MVEWLLSVRSRDLRRRARQRTRRTDSGRLGGGDRTAGFGPEPAVLPSCELGILLREDACSASRAASSFRRRQSEASQGLGAGWLDLCHARSNRFTIAQDARSSILAHNPPEIGGRRVICHCERSKAISINRAHPDRISSSLWFSHDSKFLGSRMTANFWRRQSRGGSNGVRVQPLPDHPYRQPAAAG